MQQQKLRNIIEAALMAANNPLSLTQLVNLFEDGEDAPSKDEIKQVLEELVQHTQSRGIELKQVSSGYRFQVRQEYSLWISRLQDDKPARYSRALLETLAIIAYRQPITRSEIEDIRGVSVSSNIVKTLQERGWVRIVGHRDVPGKPALIATTKDFLDYFNLRKLSELPSLAEIKDYDQMNPDLFEGLKKTQEADEKSRLNPESATDLNHSQADIGNDTDSSAIDEQDVYPTNNETNVVPFSS